MLKVCKEIMGHFQKVKVDDLFFGRVLEGDADGEWRKKLTLLKKLFGENYLDLCDTYRKRGIFPLCSKDGKSEIITPYGNVIVLCRQLIPFNYPVHYVEGLETTENCFSEYDVDNQGRVRLSQAYKALEKRMNISKQNEEDN